MGVCRASEFKSGYVPYEVPRIGKLKARPVVVFKLTESAPNSKVPSIPPQNMTVLLRTMHAIWQAIVDAKDTLLMNSDKSNEAPTEIPQGPHCQQYATIVHKYMVSEAREVMKNGYFKAKGLFKTLKDFRPEHNKSKCFGVYPVNFHGVNVDSTHLAQSSDTTTGLRLPTHIRQKKIVGRINAHDVPTSSYGPITQVLFQLSGFMRPKLALERKS